jgi:hypothetical protein
MMLLGAASIALAIFASFFIAGQGIDLWSTFFLLFSVAVAIAEFQSADARPIVDAVPAIFAVCAAIPALWLLRPTLVSILWLLGVAFVSYAIFLRIQGGSALGEWIAPEMAWSGPGLLVSIGAAVCSVAFFLKWGNAGYQYTDVNDKTISLGWFSGHEALYTLYAQCLLVLWVVRCMAKRNPLRLLDFGSLTTVLLVFGWWTWMVHLNFFMGEILFAVGSLTAAAGLIATARRSIA